MTPNQTQTLRYIILIAAEYRHYCMTIMPYFPKILTQQMQLSIHQCGHIVQKATVGSMMDDET